MDDQYCKHNAKYYIKWHEAEDSKESNILVYAKLLLCKLFWHFKVMLKVIKTSDFYWNTVALLNFSFFFSFTSGSVQYYLIV